MRSAEQLAFSMLSAAVDGGMVTTPTLIVRGVAPRYAVGTSNAAEFFVTLAISITFLFTFD